MGVIAMTDIYSCDHVKSSVYHDVSHCLLMQEVGGAENLNNPARIVRIGREHGLQPDEITRLVNEEYGSRRPALAGREVA